MLYPRNILRTPSADFHYYSLCKSFSRDIHRSGAISITSSTALTDCSTPSDIKQLSPGVQAWVQSKGWPSLRPIQSQCVTPILGRRNDVLITAPTASGKTEAAFLPVISWLEQHNRKGQGYGALCLSPLKALINDQTDRLSQICAHTGADVIAWHGDADAAKKKASWDNPGGITIMTPESLEALFACRSVQLRQRFRSLGYIVIDEYHAFFDSERGIQLISLLSRIEHAIGRIVPRIAISATVGDPANALEFLRPGNKPLKGLHCSAKGTPPPLQLKIKSFPPLEGTEMPPMMPVAHDLFNRLRGTRNIIFAGSKRYVEELTQHLNRLTVAANAPRQFYPHHGSLSKETRDETERVLKDDSKVATAIATSTLEMGIDINNIESVAQVGAPSNVAAIKQRLGRSGRRAGKAAILRILIPPKFPPVELCERLHLDAVQAAAMILLLLEGWVEPVGKSKWHLSTLIQQILGIASSTRQCSASLCDQLLRERGPWPHLHESIIPMVIQSLVAKELLQDVPETQDQVQLTEKGRKLASGFNFFTAFDIPKAYRLVVGKTNIGTLPATYPIKQHQVIIFGGTSWTVTRVDTIAPALHLEEARGVMGKAPSFGGAASFVHERVRHKMLDLLTGQTEPKHCDQFTLEMLANAREVFAEHDLAQKSHFFDPEAEMLYWFVWSSSSVVQTIHYCLTALGYKAIANDMVLIVKEVSRRPDSLIGDVRAFLQEGKLAASLDSDVSKQALGKFDRFAPSELLQKAYVDTAFDVPATLAYLTQSR